LIYDSILLSIDGIAAESNCGIFIDKNQLDGYDITLVGSWRVIAMASYLLKDIVGGSTNSDGKHSQTKVSVRRYKPKEDRDA
jgi:hypothetical protein